MSFAFFLPILLPDLPEGRSDLAAAWFFVASWG